MFKCDFHNGLSRPGELLRVVVTEWRAKTYPSQKLPPLPGTSNARWTNSGSGFEAAVTKKSCSACDAKDAPRPGREHANTPVLAA